MVLAIGVGVLWFPGELALEYLVGVTALIALYNLQFFLYFRTLKIGPSGTVRLRHATVFAYVQIVLDLIALAALVHFAGGIENPMALFFIFHIIIASILLRREVSYLVAGWASLLFALVVGLEYTGLLPHYHLPIIEKELYREGTYLLISTIVMSLTLFLVAYLTTSITARLRERDRELLESTRVSQARSHELEKLSEQLRRIDRERTRFMVMVTHELRAPVTTIYSSLELALSGYASSEKAREVLERAQNRATELLDLISDLLNLTRIREHGVKREKVAPIQQEDVLQHVVEFIKVEAEEKALDFEMDIAPDLPPVRIPSDQIKLVWTNLLSNAIKYTRPGGSVQVSLSQDGEQVVGVVRDTGIGIAPDDLALVFDEFYRASNARLISPHGTGVGLTLVQHIVEDWGGKVSVDSELGVGSEFTIILPQAGV